jgi:type I restriction enzyme S subunit
MAAIKKAPAIRFKGFVEEWEEKELEEICNYVSSSISIGNAISNGNHDLYDANGKVGYTNSNIQKNDYITIIKDGSGVGRVRLLPKNTSFIGTMGAFQVKNSDIHFLYNSLVKTDFTKHITGATIPHIYFSSYRKDIYFTPIFEEQSRIGNYFKQLDDLLQLQDQKLEKVTNLKKAMLEKMFPKERADVPEIRFKGFTAQWEEFSLKQLCSISTGKSNTQDRKPEGKFPFYVRSAIIEKSNRFLFDEEAVLTVGDGVGTGKVFHYVNGKYDLHQRVYRMFDFQGVCGKYFYYIFSKNFHKRVMAMTAKTSVDSVRLEMISEMKIKTPCIKEQSHIVNYFDNLNHLINESQQKIQQLKHLKQALLQKVFI